MTETPSPCPAICTPAREVPGVRTRVVRVGEVPRCLAGEADDPKERKKHVVQDGGIAGEVVEMGHGAASEEDDEAENGDGKI